jgi:hypothetical protein
MCGVREAMQRRGFRERRGVTAVAEGSRCGWSDSDCGRGGKQPVKVGLAQGVLQLIDRRGARESNGTYAATRDPRAAVLDVESGGGLGAIGLDLNYFRAGARPVRWPGQRLRP